MDINGIATLSTAMTQERTNQDVGIAVLKKTMDTERVGVVTLLDAIPVPSVNLPPHLGQNIDTIA